MTKDIALITGVTGQDGSYLSELLLEKGYRVIGMKRRSSTDNNERIKKSLNNSSFHLVEGDVTDMSSLKEIIRHYSPTEIYNLAAQSHVATSFSQPTVTTMINYLGVLNLLELIKESSYPIRFYQASTSEMFGKNFGSLFNQNGIDIRQQDENTKFDPQSPYAIAKVAAHNLVGTYRRAYGIFGACGILMNHESERRGENFVTRKITKWIAQFEAFRSRFPNFETSDENFIYSREQAFPKLRLGNISAHRDWGYAPDYVEAMYLMLQQEEPEDFVISTGETHSVEEFLSEAFFYIGVKDWAKYIVIDPQFYRPAEVQYLCGNNNKALKYLGWKPKVSFKDLVQLMVQSDINQVTTSFPVHQGGQPELTL